MEAISEGLSCPLCLRADEPTSMVRVAITHHAMDQNAVVLICRGCAGAVARSYSTSDIAVDQVAATGIPAAEAAASGELAQGEDDGDS